MGLMTRQKIELFRSCFSGRPDVYGTRDPRNGRAWQVKQPVTNAVIRAHLQGKQPYGVYLLTGDRTRAVVADFDMNDLEPPMEFRSGAQHYGLASYIERSKSKGHHVWMFLDGDGVLAAKARLVMRHILEEIKHPATEIFPKHDRLDSPTAFGNFIYAPLSGDLVPQGRTVFLDPDNGFQPYEDQWQVLAGVKRVTEIQLDEIIEINELMPRTVGASIAPAEPVTAGTRTSFALPPCARRMLAEGVSQNQRVSCFRLAVHLKKAGVPQDVATGALLAWASKNQPADGKRVITPDEIKSQAHAAYRGTYRGCGCEDPAIRPFCDPNCPVSQSRTSSARSTNMSDATKQKPIKQFRAPKLCVSVWKHTEQHGGITVERFSVTLQKRYYSKQQNGYVDTDTFFPDDLPRLRMLLNRAYEFIYLDQGRSDSETARENHKAEFFPE